MLFFRRFFLLTLAFFFAFPPAYADRCDRIAKKIAKSFEKNGGNDVVDTFPWRIAVPIDEEAVRQALVSSIRMWEREFDPKRMKKILKDVAEGDTDVKKRDRRFLKDQRRKAVLLRSLMPIFGRKTEVTDSFDEFVKDLGKLNDGIEKGDMKFASKRARTLLSSLPEAKKLDLEEGVKPAKVEKILERLRNERRRLRYALQKPETKADAYHTIRKEMRDYLHLMRVLNEVVPDKKFEAAFRLAEAISGKLDRAHRKVALETLGDKESYEKQRLKVTRELYDQITEFLDALWFHDAS